MQLVEGRSHEKKSARKCRVEEVSRFLGNTGLMELITGNFGGNLTGKESKKKKQKEGDTGEKNEVE